MKRIFLITGFGILLCFSTTVHAQQAPKEIAYQGFLEDGGVPVNVPTDFIFSLHPAAGGSALWTENHNNVPVSNGIYNVQLGSIVPFGPTVNFNNALNLFIRVNTTTTLTPATPLLGVPYSLGLHLPFSGTATVDGATNSVLNITNTGTGAGVEVNSNGFGFYVDDAGSDGLFISSTDDDGIEMELIQDDGIFISLVGGHGVMVDRAGEDGVRVNSVDGNGVYAKTKGTNGSPAGLYAETEGASGHAGHFVTDNAANNFSSVFINTNSTNASPLLVKTTGNGPLIEAFDDANLRFKVHNNGDVTADGTITGGGADLAESFAVEGHAARYEPGDVLVISTQTNRAVEKSATPYSTLIAGVYATKPGVLLTAHPAGADLSSEVPMGVIGVIPTKVTLEGGPIHRGDLLVTSSTPGHAMKADPDQVHVGMVLGKALAPFNGTGTGLIEVLVSVK